MPAHITNEILLAAIEGFEAQKARIDTNIAELRQMLDGGHAEPTAPAPNQARRTLSAAARARIAEAQRKRWAKSRKQAAPAVEAPKPKRRLSAAGRQRIIEATKRRWALKRAEAAKAAKTAPKKNAGQKTAAKNGKRVAAPAAAAQ